MVWRCRQELSSCPVNSLLSVPVRLEVTSFLCVPFLCLCLFLFFFLSSSASAIGHAPLPNTKTFPPFSRFHELVCRHMRWYWLHDFVFLSQSLPQDDIHAVSVLLSVFPPCFLHFLLLVFGVPAVVGGVFLC